MSSDLLSDAAPPVPGAPASLLTLLLSEPGAAPAEVVVLPPALLTLEAPARQEAAAAPVRRWHAPLILAARAVMRRPQVRQLALRMLKRSPALYARAYRMMLTPVADATPRTQGALVGDAGLSAAAAAILQVLQSLPASIGESGRVRRLALVSPLPPERSGIASYTADLLAELVKYADITLVTDQSELTLAPPLDQLTVRTSAWFMAHGDQFDQVLYQFGNSPMHSHMFALLARHPGVVVLHDFFLGGVLAHAQMSGALPGAWTQALFHAHGYEAVRASEQSNRGQAHQAWPCSLGVLENARRVIVHSQHARQLAIDWFGHAAAGKIDVIPLPRPRPPVIDRAAARVALGIAEDCFLVCSFGFIAPNKLTLALLRAWLASPLGRDPSCLLVLVGANHDSPYGMEVQELINSAGRNAAIRITGWSDAAHYSNYLQAADVGVQLRSHARGESSAAVLDCMNYGVPTIVNANGSMAELPAEAVMRLPDTFEVAELGAALATLWRDPALRRALGERAMALMEKQYRPAQCVRLYLRTLDQAQAQTAARHQRWRETLTQNAPDGEHGLRALATELARQEVPARLRQLLVDASSLAAQPPDLLMRGQLRALLRQAPIGLRVEPVWLDTSGPAPVYRQARKLTARLLGLTWSDPDEPVVAMQEGDIFYAPDAASATVLAAADAGLLAAMRARGVTVNLLVRAISTDTDLHAAPCAHRLLCLSPEVAGQLSGRQWHPDPSAYNNA